MKQKHIFRILLILLVLIIAADIPCTLIRQTAWYRRNAKMSSVVEQLFTLPPGPLPTVIEIENEWVFYSYTQDNPILAPAGIPFNSSDRRAMRDFWSKYKINQLVTAVCEGIPTDITIKDHSDSEVSFSFMFRYSDYSGNKDTLRLSGLIKYDVTISESPMIVKITLDENSEQLLYQLCDN